jgi:uncharacterized membrane protein
MEIFSDGVFAIAITLLVVELPFEQVREGELDHALREHWPAFAAFALSFLTIGIGWMHHSAMVDALARVDRTALFLNLLFLMTIAFLPFPTALIADYAEQSKDSTAATVVYSGAWLLSAVTLLAFWSYATRGRRLVREDVPDDGVRRLLRFQRGITAAYVAFTLLALVSPVATLVLFTLTAGFVVWRSDYAALDEEPGADIVPPR